MLSGLAPAAAAINKLATGGSPIWMAVAALLLVYAATYVYSNTLTVLRVTGDILRQYRVPILPEDTGGSLFDRMTALGAEAILDTIQGLLAGEITPVKQGEATTPYAAMLKKEDGRADWSLDAVVLERQVRGLYPWPGTYTFLGGKTVKLMRAGVIPEAEANACFPADAAPGTIAAPGGTRLLVRCGKGALEILELQQEGKKRMQAGDWLRGARLEAGARFELS